MSNEQKRIGDLEIVGKNLLAIAKEYLRDIGICEHDINICTCDVREQIEVAEEILAGNYYHAWGSQKGDHYRCDKCGWVYHASERKYECPNCTTLHPFRLQHEG